MQININDIYDYYVENCKENCMKFQEFIINFEIFMNMLNTTTIVNGVTLTDNIPYLLKSGKSVWMTRHSIIDKIKTFKENGKKSN
jgi:hypothetical protein